MEIENQTSDQSEIEWSQYKWEWFFATKICPDILRIGKLIDSDLPVEDLSSKEYYLLHQHLSCCEPCRDDFSKIVGGSQMSYALQIKEIEKGQGVRQQQTQKHKDVSHLPLITRMKQLLRTH